MNKTPLNPQLDLPRLFSHYSDQPWAMLLDSAGTTHVNGEFDLMLAEPLAWVVTKGDTSEVHRNGQFTSSENDPLQLIEQLIAEYFPQPEQATVSDFPFSCGAAGYFAYDLGRRFESLPVTAKADIDAPDMAVGIYSWAVAKSCKTGESWLLSHPDYPAPDPDKLNQLASKAAAQTMDFRLTSSWQSNMTQDEYQQKLSRIHKYLLAGDCYQVNLAQRFTAAYKGDEWQAYQKLREANQAPFSAFIRLENSCVMSISPERLLSVQDKEVQTKPIKGTRPRSLDKSEDQALAKALAGSDKDRAENLMIVDLLRNDMSKHCQSGSVKVPQLFAIESFPAVHHLVSTVEGRLKEDSSPLDLLRGAFPGGSITGAPKIRAMEIIEELEPHRRSVYCGSIGYLSADGRMDTSICIRTLLCENQQLYCWAGGGIVLDSDPEMEYQETLHKVNKILPVLSGEKPDYSGKK
ncbi:aminodeoxychorismate synthase component I [Lacimicrobium alkaliphilum]|uniref:aminodeoxychorismate synthase n=1 Tax=Lacimicrobium alkaliphilum TaxID=1526571 RepID=A0ABQ1R5Z4_9ALTE|nr:aminodeoxychorismate synthase component I [Lacimicrobium alkaliphilum]GGD55190.1 aminodeoxychorismate synthase, component I [Lacimicrobium alkaliphilum]